ncbi:hypothetical protein H5S40_10480 [Limosilactobacillus sp. RRLNB_1_1]|uniref:MucBP domain-containing protein n=1 Tax=Limosilactobacillus albertensis TaxID=2759752 RepID=A0A7W3Y9C5_9LACO|nr:hypothetical protein [Limosilactobacillus albertensis]MBB1070571.1 hypothetical protein [Limosilactobacillus albertensis]MCD7118950.1 hypothetical protein [Limosilactobacillus albertensis]MCD7129087.1 hypothetical protein [Limosilactobacillus albertensis]
MLNNYLPIIGLSTRNFLNGDIPTGYDENTIHYREKLMEIKNKDLNIEEYNVKNERNLENKIHSMPSIYINPKYQDEHGLNDNFFGINHGTIISNFNNLNSKKEQSLCSRYNANYVSSLLDFKKVSKLTGTGLLSNTTDYIKSIEIVYTFPMMNCKVNDDSIHVVVDESRIRDIDGLSFADENGDRISRFNINYSYMGETHKFYNLNSLLKIKNFKWENVTSIIAFGSLMPHSSYHINIPFKIINFNDALLNNNKKATFSFNEFALYDLTGKDVLMELASNKKLINAGLNKDAIYDLVSDRHTSSNLKIRVSTPVLSLDDYKNQKIVPVIQDGTCKYRVLFDKDIQEQMPKISDIDNIITNFPDENGAIATNTENVNVLWMGGYFIYSLNNIQNIIKDIGLSVDIDKNGEKPAPYYSYSTVNGETKLYDFVHNKYQVTPHFIPIVKVHRILYADTLVMKNGYNISNLNFDNFVKVFDLNEDNSEQQTDCNRVFAKKISDKRARIYYYLNDVLNNNMLISKEVNLKILSNKQEIKIFYVDLDLNNTKDIDRENFLFERTQTLIGNDGELYNNKLWDFSNFHYRLERNDDGAINGVFNGEIPIKNYYVYLRHEKQTLVENKNIIRTINLILPNGSMQVIEQVAPLKRMGEKDLVTQKIFWENWNTLVFPPVNFRPIKGYTIYNIKSETVNVKSNNQAINVSYVPKKNTIFIKYIDQDENVIRSYKIIGYTGEPLNYSVDLELKELKKEGYSLVKNNVPQNYVFGKTNNQNDEYIVSISNKIKKQPIFIYYVDVPTSYEGQLNPKVGKINYSFTQKLEVNNDEDYKNTLFDVGSKQFEIIQADSGAVKGKYDANQKKQEFFVYMQHREKTVMETKKFIRKINIMFPSNVIENVSQEAIIQRNGKLDLVTNKYLWSTWSDSEFPMFIPEPLKGYKIESIPAVKVNSNSSDLSINISYIPQPSEILLQFIDVDNNEVILEKEIYGVTGEKITENTIIGIIKSLKNKGYSLEKDFNELKFLDKYSEYTIFMTKKEKNQFIDKVQNSDTKNKDTKINNETNNIQQNAVTIVFPEKPQKKSKQNNKQNKLDNSNNNEKKSNTKIKDKLKKILLD